MKFTKTTGMITLAMALGLAGCGKKDAPTKAPEVTKMAATTDYSLVDKKVENEGELPIWLIPNMPESAEAYYGPDSYHVIAQTQYPDAVAPSHERAAGGALTWITTDDGAKKWRINDHGQDACSYIMPDNKRVVYTSTRDNLDMPVGNWSIIRVIGRFSSEVLTAVLPCA